MLGMNTKSDITRFSNIEPEFIVQAFLLIAKRGVSLPSLKTRLSPILSDKNVTDIVAHLVDSKKLVQDDGKLRLVVPNDKTARTMLGCDVGKSWEDFRLRRLPALVLGLDPDNIEVRRKLGRADALRAGIICIGFKLPTNNLLSPIGVRSELVWRVLRDNLSEVVGRGPFPLIDKSNVVDRTILAGLAGVHAKTINEAVAKLAAKVIGAEETDINSLRRRLIQIALKDRPAVDSFAERVKGVARTLSTPPFQGKVAIAQVYDDYGRKHPDAGSLESFKNRLVAAAKARALNLSRLDLPEHMNSELRSRSRTAWGSDEVHFIVTDWT